MQGRPCQLPSAPLSVAPATPAVLRCVQGLAVDKLPGVGWATRQRLEARGITGVADVQARSKQFLQAELGDKQGAMLWDFAHGRDNRQVLLSWLAWRKCLASLCCFLHATC